MEKNTPHCKLSVVKAMIEAGNVRSTMSALVGGTALGFDFEGVVGVVMALTIEFGRTCTGQPQLPARSI